jgi:peptidoglycan/xylan/chitin deacetylase (PgdA/CDA1 family)
VDDGYRDFYLVASPIFRSFQIPVTLYLPTDFLDRKSWMWGDRVQYAFHRTAAKTVEIRLGGPQPARFDLRSVDARRRAAGMVKAAGKKMRAAERSRMLAELVAALRVPLPDDPPDAYAPLAWDEVRVLSRDGVEVGAHTKSHAILASLDTQAEIADEVQGSKTRIEQEIGRPVLHFAYPNGKWEDFTEGAVRAVRDAGFRTAVTSESEERLDDCGVFRLLRVGLDPAMSFGLFQRTIAGFRGNEYR